MSRNKSRSAPSGYDKFKPGAMVQAGDPRLAGVETIPAPPPPGEQTDPVERDEDGDPVQDDATDPLPVERITEDPDQSKDPNAAASGFEDPDQSKDPNAAASGFEQEQILADNLAKRSKGPRNCELPDPAAQYNRVLTRGDAVQAIKFREGTDPLMIRAVASLERGINLLVPYALQARNEMIDLVLEIKKAHGVTLSNAEPNQGHPLG